MWFFIILFSSAATVGFIALAASTLWRFAPEDKRRSAVLEEWPWFVKGFVIPMLIWAAMNFGLSQTLQPFMPGIQAAQNSGRPWFGNFLAAMGGGLFVTSTFWTAITLTIVLWRESRKLEGETRADFRSLCLTSLFAMTLPALGLLWVAGWPVLGLAAIALLLPVVGYAPTLTRKVIPPPMYSSAIAKIKFGKYAAAESEIIRQLEGHENDFDGWLMLATLYAEQFSDIKGAEEIIMEICDQPAATPPQISIALHKLADWHLKIGSDPDAANRAMRVIVHRLPNTHLARMAEARRSQLPRSVAEMREQKIAHNIAMPSLNDDFEKPPAVLDDSARAAASARAKQLTTILTDNPNDNGARERLARIFADQLGRADLGIAQTELLLQQEGQPAAKRAEWLAMIAAWKFKYIKDVEGAQKILERIVQECPETSQCFAAQRRLSLMAAEARATSVPPMPKIIIRRD